MVNVIFYENRDIVLSQLRESVPEEGAAIKIKGRKGKVISVDRSGEKSVYVQIEFIKEKQ